MNRVREIDNIGGGAEAMNSGLRTRYDYDPWGRRVNVNGSDHEEDFGFTGHYYHAPSGLDLTLYREYSPELGRWLSRDPLPRPELLPEGPNLYEYVRNLPVMSVDAIGLLKACYRASRGLGLDGMCCPALARVHSLRRWVVRQRHRF